MATKRKSRFAGKTTIVRAAEQARSKATTKAGRHTKVQIRTPQICTRCGNGFMGLRPGLCGKC